MNIGHAFADHIKLETITRRKNREGADKPMRNFLLPFLLLLAGGVLVTRLLYLQVFQGNYYRTISDSNRIRTKIIYAPRGVIFDRNGIPLVYNKPGYRQIIKDKTVLLNSETALAKIAGGEKNIAIDSLREYPFKEAFSHIIGYVGQISEEELKSPDFSDYGLTDWVGKVGIEKRFEKELRGQNGKQLLEVDAMGKPIRTLGQTDPIPGQNITVTIDARIQQAAFAAMKDVKKGAVVITKPDGEIIAMVSKPAFDPNLFTLDTTYKASSSGYQSISHILTDSQNQPLMNRAIAGTYPPGSTFKIITAAAGLENDVIDKDFIIKDTGVIKIGQFSFSNWYFTQYGRTDGDVNVVKAISRSNDIFFYKLAEMVNVNRLSQTAGKFGIGHILSNDLIGEQQGVLPSKEWKEKEIGEQWYLGDTFIYGIGQGYLLTTPLQVNMFTNVIANGGTLYEPRLLKNQKSIRQLAPIKSELADKNQKFLSDTTVSLITEGMIQACSPGGVAWPLFEFRVKNSELRIDGKNFLEAPQASTAAEFRDYRKVITACKTGTAQHGGEKTLPHAWITLFAPAYDPEIVVTVLSESSGEGSSIAAPIAKKILEAWFTGK